MYCNTNFIETGEWWGPVGEVIRRLIAKCIARGANSEAADLFNTKQLGAPFKNGAEGIVHATRISFEKLQKSKNYGILQIDFKNAFNLIKETRFWKQSLISCLVLPLLRLFATHNTVVFIKQQI